MNKVIYISNGGFLVVAAIVRADVADILAASLRLSTGNPVFVEKVSAFLAGGDAERNAYNYFQGLAQ